MQKELIVETLQEVLYALGSRVGGYKELCCAICPEFRNDPEEAQKKVARKLNPSAKEVFSDEDMDRAIEQGRLHGCHLLKWWKDASQGYNNAEPIDRPSELLTIRTEQRQLADRQLELHQRVEELMSKGESDE